MEEDATAATDFEARSAFDPESDAQEQDAEEDSCMHLDDDAKILQGLREALLNPNALSGLARALQSHLRIENEADEDLFLGKYTESGGKSACVYVG